MCGKLRFKIRDHRLKRPRFSKYQYLIDAFLCPSEQAPRVVKPSLQAGDLFFGDPAFSLSHGAFALRLRLQGLFKSLSD